MEQGEYVVVEAGEPRNTGRNLERVVVKVEEKFKKRKGVDVRSCSFIVKVMGIYTYSWLRILKRCLGFYPP